MNRTPSSLLRVLRGPILLIALGVLLTADQFTPYGFGRTWPVLLILYGLLRLLEHVVEPKPTASYPPSRTVSPPPSGGGQ
ncbi:MAG: DUF5668 domain-containing protein [Bryobacterales bacterium]|nr:DUF5668 domain-containing protein [Bryobacteraceae bacterium]MDW8354685.1 DUF5668 domain-containing protein [Bryobacterales bacterium]